MSVKRGRVRNAKRDESPYASFAAHSAGVTPLASSQMQHAANFDFDFEKTWKIDEGATTPYLRTFLVQLTGFQSFLEEYGFDANTDPLTMANGIPLLARYVYGIVPMNKQTDTAGKVYIRIAVSKVHSAPFFKDCHKKIDPVIIDT